MDFLSDRAWLWIATAFYAIAFATSTISMVRSKGRSRGLMLALVVAGAAFQTTGLYLRGLEAGGCPVRNIFEVVQFVIWSATILYLVVGTAFRVSLLGYFTSGLAVVLSIVSLSIPGWDVATRPPVFSGVAWIEVHASLGLFAYGAFGTLALTSLMFLLQTFSLKHKHVRGLFAFLPSIVALEQINYRLLLTGLVVLTVSIVAGGYYYSQDPDSISGMKLVIATAVWFAYLIVLTLRLRRVLVSGALAWSCLALFGFALFSLGLITRPRSTVETVAGGAALSAEAEITP
ncbi:MAG: cytochrome C assembly family protein [Opitutaceae bacterium]